MDFRVVWMLVVMLTVVRVSQKSVSPLYPLLTFTDLMRAQRLKPKLRLCAARSARSVPSSATGPSAALPCGALHHTLLRQAASLTRDTGGLFLIEPHGTEDGHLWTPVVVPGATGPASTRFRGQGSAELDCGKCSSSAGAE